VDTSALVKKIYSNLEISKFEFHRIQSETSNAYSESGLLTRKLEAQVNSLGRKFSDLLRTARRNGRVVNDDPFLRDLFPIFNERLLSPHPTYKALYDTLIEITTRLTNHENDDRSDELHECLRAAFDAYRDIKRVFINLSERLTKIKEPLKTILNNIAWSEIKPD
ncbi:MAG TPA: hypothetical protein VI757_00770, partial [Bacteroidia bacterium]|nr:hypothetical protein [Bacteroidia bacterium]